MENEEGREGGKNEGRKGGREGGRKKCKGRVDRVDDD